MAQRNRTRNLRRTLIYGVLALGVVAVGIFGAAHLAEGPQTGARADEPTVTPSPTTTQQASASSAPITLAVIGASDAFGVGTEDPSTQSWPAALAQDLSSQTHLVNLGIPGATIELAARDETPIAIAAQPNTVAIFLGINDIDDGVTLATFDSQLRAMVSSLRSGTSAAIYIANLPDLSLLPYFAKDDPIALSTEVIDWNADIAAICASDGATLVDLSAAWGELAQHPEYISADGLHPSAVGADRIAQAFFTAIEGAAP